MTKERAIEILTDLIERNQNQTHIGKIREALEAFQYAIEAIEKSEEQNN